MTCEVAPHHLFLTRDSTILNSAVRPSLGAEEDRQFLWDNLQYIDIFATDHGKSLFASIYIYAKSLQSRGAIAGPTKKARTLP